MGFLSYELWRFSGCWGFFGPNVCAALERASLPLFGVCMRVGRNLVFWLLIHNDYNNPLCVFVSLQLVPTLSYESDSDLLVIFCVIVAFSVSWECPFAAFIKSARHLKFAFVLSLLN